MLDSACISIQIITFEFFNFFYEKPVHMDP